MQKVLVMFYSEACGNIMDPKLIYETRLLLEIELKLQDQEAEEAEEGRGSENLVAQSLAQATLESSTQEAQAKAEDSALDEQEEAPTLSNTLFSLEA